MIWDDVDWLLFTLLEDLTTVWLKQSCSMVVFDVLELGRILRISMCDWDKVQRMRPCFMSWIVEGQLLIYWNRLEMQKTGVELTISNYSWIILKCKECCQINMISLIHLKVGNNSITLIKYEIKLRFNTGVGFICKAWINEYEWVIINVFRLDWRRASGDMSGICPDIGYLIFINMEVVFLSFLHTYR